MGTASPGPVEDFCAALKELRQASRRDLTPLARDLAISRSQLYAVLNGEIKRPPHWDDLVQPFLRACGVHAKEDLESWRRRHDVMVRVYEELARRRRADGQDAAGTQVISPSAGAPAATSSSEKIHIDNAAPPPNHAPDQNAAQHNQLMIAGRPKKHVVFALASVVIVIFIVAATSLSIYRREESHQQTQSMKISVLTAQHAPITRCVQLDVDAVPVENYALWASWHSRSGNYYFHPLIRVNATRWRLTATIGNIQEAGRSWEFDFFYANPHLDSTLMNALKPSTNGDPPHLLALPTDAMGLQRLTLVRRAIPQDPAC